LSALEVFCCYARKDEEILKDLKKHLKLLVRQNIISVWNDADISPGSDWEHEIHQHLNSAKIILLLVSPDFMASDYCYSKEMMRAMERHDAGEAYVIPIISRPVYWQTAPFGTLQALPKDAQPIKGSSWFSTDEALLWVVKGILGIIETANQSQNTENGADRQYYEQETALTEKFILTGYVDLDRLTGGLRSSEFIIVGGMPSSGKSSFALNIASYVAIKKKQAVGIISFEMKEERIFQRLLSINAEISYHSLINGWIGNEEWDKIVSATDEIEKAKLRVYDPPTVTIPELRRYIVQMLQEIKADLIIIDSIDFILKEREPNLKRYVTDTQDAEELSFYLKTLSRELNIPIMALTRKKPPKTLYGSMPESGINSYADIVMYAQRADQYDEISERKNLMDISVTKNCHGPIDEISLYLNPDTMGVRDLEVNTQEEIPTNDESVQIFSLATKAEQYKRALEET